MLARRLFRGSLLTLALGVLLPGSTALASECQSDCASRANDTLRQCMSRCPASSMQSCAPRCKARFDERYGACEKHCSKGGDAKKASPRKKGGGASR